MKIIELISYFLFLGAIGYYFITTLQWFNYKLSRAIFHHTKGWWNYIYFLLPFALYEFLYAIGYGKYSVVLVVIYIIALIFWAKKLDKRVKFTSRVKRFFIIYFLVALIIKFIFNLNLVLTPLLIAWIISLYIEKLLFYQYKKMAKDKISKMKDLQIIGVTASYGKTSIKNFIAQILSKKFKVYATPRSVNTLGGIIKDINEDLLSDREFYIVEMGARGKGDIEEIATFLNPQYVVVGKIGPAHIEYFKTLENIRDTKMEILKSNRIKKAFIHKSAKVEPTEKIDIFGDDIKDISSTLDGISFTFRDERYEAKILGEFNAINLAAAILVAQEVGMSKDEIKSALKDIKPIEHRLQRIDAGGKIILDDSFNGNIDGMLASFDLVSSYPKRKILITPGLVEVNSELNEEVAKKANEIFDLVVVTSALNKDIFQKYIDKEKFVYLKDKSLLEEFLVQNTKEGDLILFANDAPSFI